MRLVLAYRPPLDWESLLRFLARRCTAGVEQVEDGTYRRTVRLGRRRGWFSVRHDARRPALRVDASDSLVPVRGEVVTRLRATFDLDADAGEIARVLRRDPLLAPSIRRNPGLRIPGAFDGFDSAIRIVIGQQVSVAAATTISGRVAGALGEAIETPWPGLHLLSATPGALADAGEARVAGLGMPGARARTIVALAAAVRERRLDLRRGSPLEVIRSRLLEVPGVGPWTAEVIAMRALGAGDAFPAGDLGVLRALGTGSLREAEARAERWRPWRAYAALHLWEILARGAEP